tara:strand:- start:97 stop:513 length:417 start_codon:yes stop_codon:yes gene_type:complete
MNKLDGNSIALGILVGIIVMYFLTEIRKKCFLKNDAKTLLDNNIKKLVRQSARWATAAKQDQNLVIAVLHANYGAGYLWALKNIATDDQIAEATNIDPMRFTKEILIIQDGANKRLIKSCKGFGVKGDYLGKIAGESV